jgi:hypothetical protein
VLWARRSAWQSTPATASAWDVATQHMCAVTPKNTQPLTASHGVVTLVCCAAGSARHHVQRAAAARPAATFTIAHAAQQQVTSQRISRARCGTVTAFSSSCRGRRARISSCSAQHNSCHKFSCPGWLYCADYGWAAAANWATAGATKAAPAACHQVHNQCCVIWCPWAQRVASGELPMLLN